MNMKENPYSKLLEITRKQNKQVENVLIAEVISSVPLTIAVGELQIDGDNIFIADYLLSGYNRDYSTNRLIPNGSDVGTLVYTDGVNVGDKLAIIPTADKQLYVVLARVRRL